MPDPEAPSSDPALAGLNGVRQVVACGLVFLLSSRIPPHGSALASQLLHPSGASAEALAMAAALVSLDAFGVLSALYLAHRRLRGVRLLSCYPPRRLIPLSLHFLGLLWGLLSRSAPAGVQ
ncbi:MAG: hypothetical protein ACKO0M_19380 [Cyanobium sp.]